MSDIEQIEKIEKSSKEFFKKTINEMSRIKLSTMVEVLEVFSKFEDGIKSLVEKHTKLNNK